MYVKVISKYTDFNYFEIKLVFNEMYNPLQTMLYLTHTVGYSYSTLFTCCQLNMSSARRSAMHTGRERITTNSFTVTRLVDCSLNCASQSVVHGVVYT